MADFYSTERGSMDIPGDVRSFIKNFNRKLRNSDTYEIKKLYTGEFQNLTERFFKASPWPSAEAVKRAEIVENDESFLVLYKELYFRHIYEKLTPSLNDRFDSFDNYVKLLKILLALNHSKPELDIPSVWLWDVVDEFIYQFCSFHQMRSQATITPNVTTDDIEKLKEHPHLWSAQTVVAFLHSLVKKGSKEGSHRMFKDIKAFSLVGLSRVHCLMGDYYGALETLDEVDLSAFKQSQGLLPQASLSYYLGFAYLMLHRYSDATQVLSSLLNGFMRRRLNHTGNMENVNKIITKISGVLALALGMSSQSIEEGVLRVLRDHFGDKLSRMQERSDLVAFEELFEEVCPAFVSCAVPDYSGTNLSEQPTKLQLRLFISEVRQRIVLPELTSYLKLCTAINSDKLADLANKDKDLLVSELLSSKIISKNLKRGSPADNASSGSMSLQTPIDFYIKGEAIHVAKSKGVDRHGAWFLGEILKYDDMAFNVRRIGR